MRSFLGSLCIAGFLGSLVWAGFVFRFLHPELTETQLFLANWPLILSGILMLTLGGLLMQGRSR